MKRILCLSIAAVLTAAAFAQSDENPGSLWNDHVKNPFAQRTAHAEGDILTVLISETSSASYQATTSTGKKDSTSVPSPNIPIIGGLFKSLGFDASSATTGTGATQQAGSLIARMTVIVRKVLPNGNLQIEGARTVHVNKDTQLVHLTGLVRPDDIAADNTILSEKIADAVIRSEGKGQIADRQRQGFFTKILSYLF